MGDKPRAAVICSDFGKVAKLQNSNMVVINRVLPSLSPNIAPQNAEEVLVVDDTIDHNDLSCELGALAQKFSLIIALTDGTAENTYPPGVMVVSLEDEVPKDLSSGWDPASMKSTPMTLRPQTVVVFNPKGGVGRTTLATNLAARARSGLGIEVALIDFDVGGGDVAMHLDLLQKPTIMDLVAYGEDITPELLMDFTSTYHPSGVYVLPAPGRPELVELAPWERLAPVLKCAQRLFDLVVIDTPGDPGSKVARNLAREATYVLAPVLPDLSSPRRLKIALNQLASEQASFRDKARFFLNRNVASSVVTSGDLETFLGLKRVGSFVDVGSVLDGTIDKGRPLVLTGDDHGLSDALDKVLADAFGFDFAPRANPWWQRLLPDFLKKKGA